MNPRPAPPKRAGKVALVTGASYSVGRAGALNLAGRKPLLWPARPTW